jgi:hypothetical protein
MVWSSFLPTFTPDTSGFLCFYSPRFMSNGRGILSEGLPKKNIIQFSRKYSGFNRTVTLTCCSLCKPVNSYAKTCSIIYPRMSLLVSIGAAQAWRYAS